MVKIGRYKIGYNDRCLFVFLCVQHGVMLVSQLLNLQSSGLDKNRSKTVKNCLDLDSRYRGW